MRAAIPIIWRPGKGENSRRFLQLRKKKRKPRQKTGNRTAPARLKFSFKEQKEYETIDEEIAGLEDSIRKLDEENPGNATNAGCLAELTAKKEETEKLLEQKMDRWVYLNDLAEKIEAQKK